MSELRDTLQTTLGAAYTIERELGGGGMSRVFVAEETRFRRRVVIKVLSPELAAAISVQRFEREITMAAQLQQANIVSVITAGESGGLPFFTMPFVEGQSLRARLAAGPLSISETISVLRDVARALAYAHARGIVHRDIKPDNVLLSGAAAVVTDFGIAKALADAADDRPQTSTNLTLMGTSIGTPAYMAPEQAAGDPDVDHRADIYAFGCMAYELLTGAPPFHGRTPQRVLAAHMSEMPRPIGELRPDASAPLTDLIMHTLAKNPAERPQTATDLLHTLEGAGSGATGAMPRFLVGSQGMFKRALAIYVLAFIVVAVAARAAIIALGLPDWVFPGALVVMALGLPVILFTGYAHHVARRLSTTTPTLTPGGSAAPHGTMATIAVNASPHLSWRRATKGGAFAVATFVVLIAAFMTFRALGIGPFGSLLAAGRLKQREPLLLTEFKVVNSDSTLGRVISQAVRSNLEQSEAITLVPPATVTLALQRMKQAPSARVDLALAQDLAAREGIKAIVDGEVAGVGNGYLVTLRIVTADSGRELASFREAADGVKGLIAAVDVVTRKLRGRIGESLRDVRASPPLAQVTTGSIDALRKYSAAVEATARLDNIGAASLSREAIALDTSFALAYRHLGEALNNLATRRNERDSAMTKAFRMRDRLTERERLAVEGQYYALVVQDRPRAIDAYRALLSKGVYSETNSLGVLVASRREYASAESLYRLRIRMDPANALSYSNLANRLTSTGQLAAADSVLNRADRLFPRITVFPRRRAQLMYVRDGVGPARHFIDSLQASRPSLTLGLLEEKGLLSLVEGELRDHARLTREARAGDSVRGTPRDPVTDSLAAVRRDAWLLPASTRNAQRVDAAVASALPTAVPYTEAAATYAIAGRPDLARSILARYEAEVRDTQRVRIEAPLLHTARGEIALAEHRGTIAAAEFTQADRLPDGPANDCASCLFVQLARAYDAADNIDSTAALIRRYLDTPSARRLDNDALYLAPFLKRLGEIAAAKGDNASAAASYRRFVELWKNADAELQPKVREVRQRLTRLPMGDAPRR